MASIPTTSAEIREAYLNFFEEKALFLAHPR